MEQIVLGPNIKTKQGFEIALAYANNKTLNVTFEKIIGSIINEAEDRLNVDPNAIVDDLASFVANACFYGKTIDLLGNTIINCNDHHMKPFLRQCLSHLGNGYIRKRRWYDGEWFFKEMLGANVGRSNETIIIKQ
ncbi:unnamed protein product [Rotaria sp. Silwood2]|nr:unnamed protein product [Rotaria sp. Silwood2]